MPADEQFLKFQDTLQEILKKVERIAYQARDLKVCGDLALAINFKHGGIVGREANLTQKHLFPKWGTEGRPH